MEDLLDPLQPELRSALAGRYEVEGKVGEGGMATVYLARDQRHGRRVALKVLRPGLAASAGPDRFLREIQVVANLQHPHILPLFDSGRVPASGHGGDTFYFVMPFVEGESLRRLLVRQARIPLGEALRISREAADALSYAHQQDVVHCDIKPENLLLQNGHVLVADFGIARAADALEHGSGQLVGTPQYMSPEQALGETELDGRSDVYSLACVLHEMLTGAPVFEAETATTVIARHSLEMPAVEGLEEVASGALQDALRRALAKTPSERPSMREFAAVLADLEAEARRPSRSRGNQRWLMAGLVFLTLIAGLVWALRFGRARRVDIGPELDPRHIAVLYFQPRLGQDSLTYLADGVTEELIHQLSRVPMLQVISQNGVAPYRHTSVPPDSIARTLKVGTLVQGTLAQSSGRLRITVALIDGGSGAELASTSFDRPHQEIFALQDDLAQEVAIFLRQRLGEEVQRKVAESRAQRHVPRAWHLYQHAEEVTKEVSALLAAGDTSGAADRLGHGDSLLVLAQRAEPSWAKLSVARGRIAYARLDLVGTFDKEYYNRWTLIGLAHAQRALRLDAEDPEALDLRGSLRYYRWLLNLVRDQAESARLLSGAEADLEAAVAADPTSASAWTVLSHLRMNQSQPAQAKLAALHAYQADPYLASARQTLWRLFQTSLDLEDTAESRRWCEEGGRRFPHHWRFAECRLWLYVLKGQSLDLDELEPVYRRYVQLAPPTARVYHEHYGLMVMAIALARAGLRDSADKVARRARADTTVDETRDLAQLEAIARTMLGERDEALRLLGVWLSANPQFRESMARDSTWWLRDLRGDPRYQRLVAAPRQVPKTR